VPINSDLGFHYYYTGQYEEALKQLKFVLELDGKHSVSTAGLSGVTAMVRLPG
jgi:hypothetical protein